jgi:glycosyltransferase involved in cell wall biosynthesis
MKIAFNASLLRSGALRGWNRYTVNLLRGLSEAGVRLYLYGTHPIHPDHMSLFAGPMFTVKTAPQMHYTAWEQYWLPRQCKRDQIDILHSPFNFGLPCVSPCFRILTLHDSIGQGKTEATAPVRSGLNRTQMQMALHHWSSRKVADHIIAVSNHAREDMISNLGISTGKVTVIYEAAEERFSFRTGDADRQRIRTRYNLERPYLLYIGGWDGRKNVPFLLRAFAKAGLSGIELVLAGGDAASTPPIRSLIDSLQISDRVRLLGWVDDGDLPALYGGAMCFVYPSEYEGFGLQLCEAMAAGCPTLASRAASLPEVLGSGGETFGLDDTGELVELLRKMQQPLFRMALSERARRRSTEFSWRSTAEQTIALYRRVSGLV